MSLEPSPQVVQEASTQLLNIKPDRERYSSRENKFVVTETPERMEHPQFDTSS